MSHFYDYLNLSTYRLIIKRNITLVGLFLSLVLFSFWSILLGQDANWDLKNYHYYNAYAVFWGRLSLDIAPAQLQTYFNPTIDLIPYILIQYFPPRIFGIVLGAWHGLNLWLVFLIAREIFTRVDNPRPIRWAVIGTLASATGSILVGEVGTTLHDLTVSVFVLGSIYLYLMSWSNSKDASIVSFRKLMLSGFLLGLGVGFKLTMAIYAVGMGVAIIVIQVGLFRRVQGLVPFFLSALLGLLLSGGWWMVILWKQFGNPLFPMLNKVFKSPYAIIENFSDTRFLPDTILHALYFPFNFTMSTHAGSELAFQDFRIGIFYVASAVFSVFILIPALLAGRKAIIDSKDHEVDVSFLWLLVFIWVSYLLWIILFSIHRYLICVELLVPIVLIAFVGRNINLKNVKVLMVTILIFIVATTRPPDYGRLPWADRFFGVDVPAIERPDKAVVLISSNNPLSYVIPWFPEVIRFVRIEGNFPRYDQATALTKQIEVIIHEAVDDLYLLTDGSEVNDSLVVVNNYMKNKVSEVNACEPITSRFDRSLVLCRLSFKENN